MSKGRKKHSPAFKVKVALEAVKGMVPIPLGSPRVSPSAPIWSRQHPLCKLLWFPVPRGCRRLQESGPKRHHVACPDYILETCSTNIG